jgi:hypothetical protein
MDKTDRKDLLYLIKHYILWLPISIALLVFVGASIKEAFTLSFVILTSGGLFLWFFIHPSVKAKER